MNRDRFTAISTAARVAEKDMTAVYVGMLTSQIGQFTRMVRSHGPDVNVLTMLDNLAVVWEAAANEVRLKWALAFAVDGYNIANALIGGKCDIVKLAMRGKVNPDTMDGGDEISSLKMRRKVEKWIKESSKVETATTAKKLAKIFQEVSAEGMGTDAFVSRIIEAGLKITQERAALLAQVITNWAYNEGAQASYMEASITKKEWLTARDEATCGWCGPMDGMVVALDANFADAHVPIYDKHDKVITPEFDIQHPPLHPLCRCALVPVIDEEGTGE